MKERKGNAFALLFSFLLLLSGCAVMLYPHINALWMDHAMRRDAEEFFSFVEIPQEQMQQGDSHVVVHQPEGDVVIAPVVYPELWLEMKAILNAINSVMSPKETLVDQITDAMQQEILTLPDSTLTLGEINRRIGELEEEMTVLLTYENALEIHGNRFSEIAEEMKQLKQEREALSTQLRNNVQAFNRLQKATKAMDQAEHRITEWSEETIRQLVHTVKVISKDHIKVYLYDGTEIDQEVRKQQGKL